MRYNTKYGRCNEKFRLIENVCKIKKTLQLIPNFANKASESLSEVLFKTRLSEILFFSTIIFYFHRICYLWSLELFNTVAET